MKNSVPIVKSLHYYPLKSGAGNPADRVNIAMYGIPLDRQFMLITANNNMVTARTHPRLLEVTATSEATRITFHAPARTALKIDISQLSRHPQQTAVWDDAFSALSTDDTADLWFTQLLGESVRLVYNGDVPLRRGGESQMPLNLADTAPLLLISEDSLNYLNAASSETHVSPQFRPNIVVQGGLPFDEDSWKTLRIGEVMFAVSGPCARCVLTTFDQQGRQKKNNEPMATLSQFRRDTASGEIHFGMYLTPLNPGEIHSSDPVEVLEVNRPPSYINHLPQKIALVCDEVEPVCRDVTTFWFKRADALPLPSYHAGQHLPITLSVDQQTCSRCYTLSSTPTRRERWSITVKKIPSGMVSGWLHHHMHVGSPLLAAVPEGDFFLEQRPEFPLALITAGSGITPAISMLRMLADRHWIDDVIFFYQCQTSLDIPFSEELQLIQREHPSLKIFLTLSQPDSTWEGLSGRFNADSVTLFPDLLRRHIYSCGPTGFMEGVRKLFIDAGLPESNWHQESFGCFSERRRHPYKSVTIEVNGRSFCGNNQETVLLQAENAGITMTCSCRAGVCGKCKVRLNAGAVEHPKGIALSNAEIRDGFILACSAIPLENISVKGE